MVREVQIPFPRPSCHEKNTARQYRLIYRKAAENCRIDRRDRNSASPQDYYRKVERPRLPDRWDFGGFPPLFNSE
uniref:Uncharacterized protein n=1 Tax=Magnetospirillum gryphiswaldense TaxID=55518 RepID=A4U0K2_9PROT|nr:hypothetical protein MGR_1301 [Magnetospirillum gryphiswaldense MSR-1]